MQTRLDNVRARIFGRHWHAGVTALLLGLCLVASGCSSSLAKHSSTFSGALAPVVDQSTAAYQGATTLHNLRSDYEAVVAYENKDATYNPRDTPVLLSEKDIQSRLAVLAALQVYAKSLADITRSPDSTDLDSASKSAGSDLTSLGNGLAPSIEKVLGISAASGVTKKSSTPAAPLTPEIGNGISTAIDALGQFLVSRKVAKELPAKIEAMDGPVQTLTKTLEDDIQTIQGIEQRDYDRILDLEKQFILEDAQTVNTQQRRAEIMKLPELARQQSDSDEKLSSLRKALEHLATTHHDLAIDAQNKSPETLKEKLGELASAGNSLGKFYSSLSAK